MVSQQFEEAKKPKVHYSLPKADMHVHISLALSNDMFTRRVKKRRTPLELNFLVTRENRYYPNLTEFHNTYESCRGMTVDNQELANTTQTYLERIAKEGAVYAEISNSFREGDIFTRQMEAVCAGMEAARANTGIESRIIVTALRNSGVENAENAVKAIKKLNNPYITGFGLVGDEGVNKFSDFTKALNMAWHEAGLGLTPHVAEQDLHNAVDFLQSVPNDAWNISQNDPRRLRVGHGVLIHMSSDLMHEFADREICMELCLSANKRIGLPKQTKNLQIGDVITSDDGNRSITIDHELRQYYETVEDHPIKNLIDAGIPVCLGSDNPLLMNTNIGKEYSMAYKAGVIDSLDHLNLTNNALLHANIDQVTRLRLLAHISQYKNILTTKTHSKQTALGYRHAEL